MIRLHGVRTERSPLGGGRVRLIGDVRYEHVSRLAEDYWFDVPSHCAEHLSTSGNPWLACLAPLAATEGVALEIGLPVDAGLRDGIEQLMHIWRAWYPEMHVVPVESDVLPVMDLMPEPQLRRGAFFSGGTDSLFTALDCSGDVSAEAGTRVQELLLVHGFDIPLAHAAVYSTVRDRSRRFADAAGLGLLDVATNLRQTRWARASWAWVAHGPALASIALALEPRFGEVFISATGGYRDLHFWGSHVLTDPLFSTSRMRIAQHGAHVTRREKTERLVGSASALEALRVCWRSPTAENCGQCGKCHRSMLMLDLLGALHRCPTFPRRRADLAAVERVFCRETWDDREFRDIRALAAERGREDVVRLVDRVMRRSRRMRRGLELARRLRDQRLVWRMAGPLERRILAGSVA